jgi:hypothetical protein
VDFRQMRSMGTIRLYLHLCNAAAHEVRLLEGKKVSDPFVDLFLKTLPDAIGITRQRVATDRKELKTLRLIQEEPLPDGRVRIKLLDPTTGKPLPLPGTPEFDHQSLRAESSHANRQRQDDPLTPEEILHFYKVFFPDEPFTLNAQVSVRCPWHDDRRPSFSIDLSTGKWYCHGECSHGGHKACGWLFEFLVHAEGLDPKNRKAVFKRINTIIGRSVWEGHRPAVAIYDYDDGYDNDCEVQIRKYDDENHAKHLPFIFDVKAEKWINKAPAQGSRKLYHRREVLAASTVIVCEGERDVESIRALHLLDADGKPVAATTNILGAGKWLARYAEDLLGKNVIGIYDYDYAGVEHMFNDVIPSIKQTFSIDATESQMLGKPPSNSAVMAVNVARDEDYDIDTKWDVSDFVAAHGDNAAADLVKIINAQIGAEWLTLPAAPASSPETPAATGSPASSPTSPQSPALPASAPAEPDSPEKLTVKELEALAHNELVPAKRREYIRRMLKAHAAEKAAKELGSPSRLPTGEVIPY